LDDDVLFEEQNGEDSFLAHEDSNAVDDEKVDDSTAETPMTPGGVPSKITEAEPGREYTMWPGEGDGPLLENGNTNIFHLRRQRPARLNVWRINPSWLSARPNNSWQAMGLPGAHLPEGPL
jgi:hypothetical protein